MQQIIPIIFEISKLLCFISFIIGVAIFLTYFNNRQTRFDDNIQVTKDFSSYLAILQYFMDKAYDIVYKEKIMVYSMDASKVDEKDYNETSKQFCKLTLKMMGNRFKNQFIDFFGSEDTFLFNLTEYFNLRIENDPIREAALEKLSEKKENEETNLNNIFNNNKGLES